MLKRRLIRSLFAIPIVLCLVGWGWSISHGLILDYTWGRQEVFSLSTEWGVLYFTDEIAYSDSDGWMPPQVWNCSLNFLQYNDRVGRKNFLGFARVETRFYTSYAIPYWFLLTLSSTLYLLIHLKTRPTPPLKTAFPIDVKSPDE